jgi:hypothetical protein
VVVEVAQQVEQLELAELEVVVMVEPPQVH